MAVPDNLRTPQDISVWYQVPHSLPIDLGPSCLFPQASKLAAAFISGD